MQEETASTPLQGTRSLHLQSIEKIAHLPVISSTISLTQGLYGKVKESNVASKVILELAEHSVQKAAQLAEPVAATLEKPIKLADCMVCNTIDFVGHQLVKAGDTPQKLTNVLHAPVQPAVDCAKMVGSYGAQKIGYWYNKFGSSKVVIETETEMETEEEADNERETEPEKYDRGTQTPMTGNVRSKVKMFSEQ